MKFCYRDKKFHDKSLALIDTCNNIIEDMQAQGYKLTLRQLYYQLVTLNLITNSEKSYDNIGALLSDARLAGLVDWDAIEDRLRHLRGLPHWNDPSEIVKSSASQFNFDLWEDQDTRIEVWVEKEALAGIISRSAVRLDVPYLSCKGYTSQSEMWGAGQRIVGYGEEGKNTVILHLGDHDPSGIDMTRDIDERLTMFCEGHGQPGPIIKRIALNMNQVRQYNPPPNPTKITDCRSPKYIAQFGHECWELDALTPKVIDDLITEHINQNLDVDKFKAAKRRQEVARAELREIADNYTAVLAEHREFAKIHDAMGEDSGSTPEGVADNIRETREALQHRSNLLDERDADVRVLMGNLKDVRTENTRLQEKISDHIKSASAAVAAVEKQNRQLEKEVAKLKKSKK